MSEPTIGQLVGAALRFERERRGWTQTDVARALRDMGLKWPRPRLANLESGRREDVTLREFIALAVALEVPAARLLQAPPGFGLEWHQEIGEPWPTSDYDPRLSFQKEPQVEADANEVRDFLSGPEPRNGWPAIRRVYTYSSPGSFVEIVGEVERRTAAELKCSADEVVAAARHLYGTGLVEERERRLRDTGGDRGERGERNARRGHITREIMRELRQHLEASR